MRKGLALLLLGGWFVTLRAATVVFIGAAGDSDLFSEAFRDLGLPPAIVFEHRCAGVDGEAALLDAVKRADVLILNARSADVRSLAPHVDLSKTRLYALSARLLPREIPAQEPPEVMRYRENRRPENFRNMVRWIVHRELDPAVTFEPPVTLPEIGATHPAANKIFDSLAAYRRWAKSSGHFKPDAGLIAFAVHAASINPAELALFQALTDECEKQGLNVAIVYGDEPKVIRRLLLDAGGRSQVDAVLALSFKFKAGLGEDLRTAIRDLDVPIFNALRLYRQTTPEWAESVRGMNDFSVAFGFIAPEISGLRAEAGKLSRALDRLKKAFLFDDGGIPESEYLSTRADLQERLTAVNNKIADALTGDSYSEAAELSFVNSASSFLLSYRLQSGDHIDYSDFAATVDKTVLKDFVNLVIDKILIKDSKVVEIIFKNGLRNRFEYD